MHDTQQIHIPVLLDAVLELANPIPGESYLDVTAGYGGHAGAVLEKTGAYEKAILVDRDKTAIDALQSFAAEGVDVRQGDFLSVSRDLQSEGRTFDMILADLGVSSLHLDDSERGFSFSRNGPLDMRMDQTSELSAEIVVNTWKANELEDILRRFGEEYRAPKIVQAILAGRPFHDTASLAEVIKRALPGKPSKTHPATKTFQAIRIAVNDELGLLEKALPIWLNLLKPGGRLLVISFHSLEDRIVKQTFADVSGERYDAEFLPLTKKPITADEHELVFNPRARSAKLRAVVKIKTKKGK